MRKSILMLITACSLSIAGITQVPYPANPVPAGNIVKAEYYFDKDPGYGNGTVIVLTPAANINNFATNIAINGAGLINGFHRLYIRTQDINGTWSLTQNAFFDNVVVPVYPAAPPAIPVLQEAEYFIDTDPGQGMATKVGLSATTNVSNMNVLVNITGLTPGFHRLYIRTKDTNGKWSLTNFSVFDNSSSMPYPTAVPAPPVSDMEYYIDTDPGFGNGTKIIVPAATDVPGFSAAISVAGLSDGPHTLYLRSRQNPWSLTAYAEFSVGSTLPVTWSYVKGELINDGALISWVTAQESNTKGFIVEHSTDGVRYTAVGTVAAAGTSEVPVSYRFKHNSPSKGINYYRIRQTDLDGEFTVSKVIPLLNNNNLRETIVAPNPVKDMVHIIEPTAVAVRKVEVYDINGRLVLTEPVGGQSRQVISLSLNTLKTGHYTIKVSYENKVRSFQVIKQ